MRHTATDDAGTVSVTRHVAKRCKNGLMDQGSVWDGDSWGPKKHCLKWGSISLGPMARGGDSMRPYQITLATCFQDRIGL